MSVADTRHDNSAPVHTLRHNGLTPQRQAAFIEALAATGSVSAAAGAAGVSRTAIYNLRNRKDEAGMAFRAAWDARVNEVVAVLADAAIDRAVGGVEEPVFYKGEQVGIRIRHNDRLLMFLLKTLDPETFAQKPAARENTALGAPLALSNAKDCEAADSATVSTMSTSPAAVPVHRPAAIAKRPAHPSTLSTSASSSGEPDTPDTFLNDDPERHAALRAARTALLPRPPGKRTARRLAAKQRAAIQRMERNASAAGTTSLLG